MRKKIFLIPSKCINMFDLNFVRFHMGGCHMAGNSQNGPTLDFSHEISRIHGKPYKYIVRQIIKFNRVPHKIYSTYESFHRNITKHQNFYISQLMSFVATFHARRSRPRHQRRACYLGKIVPIINFIIHAYAFYIRMIWPCCMSWLKRKYIFCVRISVYIGVDTYIICMIYT